MERERNGLVRGKYTRNRIIRCASRVRPSQSKMREEGYILGLGRREGGVRADEVRKEGRKEGRKQLSRRRGRLSLDKKAAAPRDIEIRA